MGFVNRVNMEHFEELKNFRKEFPYFQKDIDLQKELRTMEKEVYLFLNP